MHTGIDMGLKVTAIVTLDDDGRVLFKEHFGSEYTNVMKEAIHIHPCDRYNLYFDRLIQYFEVNQITGTIIMEDPMGRMLGKGRKIIELKGLYVVALAKVTPSYKVFLPKPTQIKLSFTGDGAATKEDMIRECKKRGIYPRHSHDADSVAMAFMSIDNYFADYQAKW